MKVAQILYHTCPLASEEGKESGGANVYVLKLSEELAKLGIQVDMFTRSEDPNVKHTIELNKNLRLIHLKAGPEKTLPKNELINYIPEFSKNLSRFFETLSEPPSGGESKSPLTHQYNLLDCHYYMSGLAILSLLRTMNYEPRTLITFHTLGLIKNLVARSPSETADETRIQAEKELVQKFDAIVAPSKNERDYLHFLYNADPKKINIISPGFDPEIFKPLNKIEAKKRIGACPDHKIILFVGRIEPLKGIDSLLYATKIAFEKFHTKFCVFVIGGEKNSHEVRNSNPPAGKAGETMKKPAHIATQSVASGLNNLKNELGLHTSVKFINQVDQHTLADYYNAADVVVMPSHYESFGMTALEAMACETPVIVTETAGISSILTNNHRSGVISAGNPLLLAERIHHILENEKYHEKLSGEIKNTIKNLTWENTAKEVTEVYKKLLTLY